MQHSSRSGFLDHGTPPPSYPALATHGDCGMASRLAEQQHQQHRLDPWLGLRARLFLSIASYGLVALLFLGTRLISSASNVDQQVQRSNDTLWSACRETEQAATLFASFPHLLADNFNNATTRAVDDTVQGLGTVLILSLFLCVVELVVRGSLELLINAVNLISGVVHDTAQAIQASIQGSIDGINAALRSTLGGMNDILKIVGQHVTIPTVPMPDLSTLNNVQIPNSLQDSLVQLNSSLPTLAELKARMDILIQTPFENLKREVNTTIGNFAFNQSTLPVPQMQSISYCNGTLDTKPLEELGHDLKKITHVGIGLLVLFACLLLAFGLVREWYSWQSLQRHVSQTREAFLLADSGQGEQRVTLDGRSLLSLLQLSTHPLLARWGLRGAEKMGVRSKSGKIRMRWLLAWISHPVGLVLLTMGAIGLIGVQMQIAAVDGVRHNYQGRFSSMIDDSTAGLQNRLDSILQGMSHDYANRSNLILLRAEDDLNSHLFDWVNVTTSTMNNTLNEFMDGIATAINSTFAHTPLYSSVQTFIDCIIGQKVAGIEKALTWMQSNAHVDFPSVPDNVFMVQPSRVEELMGPVQRAATGSDGVLDDLVGAYLQGLEKDRILFLILLLLYLFLLLVGTLIAVLVKGRDCSDPSLSEKNDGNGGPFGGERALPPPFGFVTDRRSASPAVGESHRSISKPLHPDVVSLYHPMHPYQASNGVRSVANHSLPALSSWESLSDTRAPGGQDEKARHEGEWNGRRSKSCIKSTSVDSAWSKRSANPSDDCHSLSAWLWRKNGEGQGGNQEDKGGCDGKSGSLDSSDSLRLISAPTSLKSSGDGSIQSSYFPASCESIHFGTPSDLSFRISVECPSYLQPPRHSTSDGGDQHGFNSRTAHLSNISERPESIEVICSPASPPRLFFSLDDGQGEEVRLERGRSLAQSLSNRPGQAF